MMNEQQISLGLGACGRRRGGRRVGTARARWWFERMHRVVEAAAEWKPAAVAGQGRSQLGPEPERKAA